MDMVSMGILRGKLSFEIMSAGSRLYTFQEPPLLDPDARAVRSNRFRFDFRFQRRRYLSIRFDRKLSQLSRKFFFSRKIGQCLRRDPPGCQKQLAKSFVITFCEIFTFYDHVFFIFCFKNLLQIESYRRSKISFDSICIRFDSTQNIRFDSQIRFDFDSI
jgi:hypothetical protein